MSYDFNDKEIEKLMRPGSCLVAMDGGLKIKAPDVVMADISFLDKPVNKLLLTTDGKEVPKELLKKMQDYARLLHKKFPHMKPDRVKRKVAEHFKIKLV